MSDDNKVVIIDFMLNSIDNGYLDEDVHQELVALEQLAKTIKRGFVRHVELQLIQDTIRERIGI